MGQWLDLGEPFDIAPPRPTEWYEYKDDYLLAKLNILQFYGTCYRVMYKRKISEINQEERDSAK